MRLGADVYVDHFLTPATLAMALWPDGEDRWIPQKHLLYASSRIAHAIMRGNGRLIVSMPPRHGKSRLISETTIPWFLEKFPGRHVMLVSYNEELAVEFGGKAKDLILAKPDLFSFQIRDDRARVDRFETQRGNIVRFSGIKGGQTGKGAHLFIIDDFLKGIGEAMSPVVRQDIWNSFLANLHTRLEPGSTMIIVATRWHTDDLIGRLLKHVPGEFEYIEFPAIAKEADVLGRKVGQPLFPERFPIEELMRRKKLYGSMVFEALYQQKPIDADAKFTNGAWLKRLAEGMEVDAGKVGLVTCRAWDMAATNGGGDFTVGTRMSRVSGGPRAFVENVYRGQLSPNRIERKIREIAVADGVNVTVLLEQEPGSQSKQLIEHYRNNVLPEFEVIEVPVGNVKNRKTVMAQPFVAACEAGNVYMYAGDWTDEFVAEFDAFPPDENGHDDQVDTAAMAYNHLFQDVIESATFRKGAIVDQPLTVYRDESELLLVSGGKGGGGVTPIVTGATWGRPMGGIRRISG